MNKLVVNARLKFNVSLIVILCFTACISQKKIVYFQNLPKTELINPTKPIQELKTGDIVAVTVNSVTPDAASFFNNNQYKSGSENNPSIGYLINENGKIDLPIIGAIQASRLTIEQLQKNIALELDKYLVKPIVNVRITNFKITLIGEFNKPGMYLVENGNIDLLEAIGLASDLTIYANRSIQLIREIEGKKQFYTIDLTNKNHFNERIYLKSGDVIYAEPNKGKKSVAESFYKIVPIVTSALTLIVLLIVNTVK